MTTTEVIQLCSVLLFLAVSYWWFWTWADREQRNALINTASTQYRVARTGSMLIPSFDPFVEKGASIYIPTSDGLYATLTSLGDQYRKGLMSWLRRGATVHVVVTRPGPQCRAEWQVFIDAFAETFLLHELDREALSADDALLKSQIQKLDTFHPVLLINPCGGAIPGAMWIEGFHAIGSKYAYNVEFIHPSDVALDVRFEQYKQMYDKLLKGSHVITIQGNRKQAHNALAA